MESKFLLIFIQLNFKLKKKQKNYALPPASTNPQAAVPNEHFFKDGPIDIIEVQKSDSIGILVSRPVGKLKNFVINKCKTSISNIIVLYIFSVKGTCRNT